jgi:hypothetical protein
LPADSNFHDGYHECRSKGHNDRDGPIDVMQWLWTYLERLGCNEHFADSLTTRHSRLCF